MVQLGGGSAATAKLFSFSLSFRPRSKLEIEKWNELIIWQKTRENEDADLEKQFLADLFLDKKEISD